MFPYVPVNNFSVMSGLTGLSVFNQYKAEYKVSCSWIHGNTLPTEPLGSSDYWFKLEINEPSISLPLMFISYTAKYKKYYIARCY